MADEDPDDPLPGLRAELDQTIAMAPELARVARGMYDALRAEEFDDSQALYLTICQILSTPGRPP